MTSLTQEQIEGRVIEGKVISTYRNIMVNEEHLRRLYGKKELDVLVSPNGIGVIDSDDDSVVLIERHRNVRVGYGELIHYTNIDKAIRMAKSLGIKIL
mgnify:FL=1